MRMRELRTQSGGRPLRTLYIFDPSRTAVLLIGGDKTGNNRWYEQFVPVADRIYEQYLREIRKEGIDCERERTLETLADGFEAIRKCLRNIEATAIRQFCSPEMARHLRALISNEGKV